MDAALVAAPVCDCCNSHDWQYLFSSSGHDLGRCASCGLHYVAEVPSPEQRMTEFEKGHFGDLSGSGKSGHIRMDSTLWARGEHVRRQEFDEYLDIAEQYAPKGRWLDVGCGAGFLLGLTLARGIDAQGLELDLDRAARAREAAQTTVFTHPLEELNLPADSYAAVTMVNVFSHLISPTETLKEVRRILMPAGILLLHTSEIKSGVRQKHHRTWMLGDHLMFLGENTIERYADKLNMELVQRRQIWQPERVYSLVRLMSPSRSRAKNSMKLVLRITPGALSALRWYGMNHRDVDSPMFESTLLLRKPV
jgi:2-polyprenyl-3-methyl-5-hydroxy-6-metoxy-1,4-benzoquinol methylase